MSFFQAFVDCYALCYAFVSNINLVFYTMVLRLKNCLKNLKYSTPFFPFNSANFFLSMFLIFMRKFYTDVNFYDNLLYCYILLEILRYHIWRYLDH